MNFSKNFLTVFLFIILLWSCKKATEDNVLSKSPPGLTTGSVTSITTTAAVSGGTVTGFDVSARGVCWSSSHTPSITDSTTSDGTVAGDFTSTMTKLTPKTIYKVRAFATNPQGTGYGNTITFTTL